MANQFAANSTVTYDVAVDGTTTVTHDITLQNLTSDFYATSYTLSLNGITPIDPVAYEGNANLPVKIKQSGETTSIEVDFPDEVVGKDSKREFSISFTDKTLVNKTGEIWEITTPKLADPTTFDFYSTIIKIPNSFGQLAYVSPNPTFKDNQSGKMIYSFDKSASVTSVISAAFGNFQVFTFNLTYHLENTLNEEATTQVALPPDTNYQKVNYTAITPKPTKVEVDQDGNWLATFDLKPRQKVDAKVAGAVQIFASPLEFPKTDYKNVTKDLQRTNYWQTDDPAIKALAQSLKTPQAIYNYVITHLNYDYSRVAPNVERFGASRALQNPKNAICTEFTDLFIAIARAAGIPAREIEGFAYTDNPRIQPLSLVADVLHAWPEYWDSGQQAWVPVDPTWGSTSGIDYFNKLDLRHFAFVIHGSDSVKPYPAGSYKGAVPQKDVQVIFGQLPKQRGVNLQVENSVLSQLPFSDEIVSTKITNSGTGAAYNESVQFTFDNVHALKSRTVDVIPPYGSYETNVDIPYSFLGQKTPAKVQVLLDGTKQSEFTTYKSFVTISNLLMMFLFVFFIVFVVYLKFKDAKAKKHS